MYRNMYLLTIIYQDHNNGLIATYFGNLTPVIILNKSWFSLLKLKIKLYNSKSNILYTAILWHTLLYLIIHFEKFSLYKTLLFVIILKYILLLFLGTQLYSVHRGVSRIFERGRRGAKCCKWQTESEACISRGPGVQPPKICTKFRLNQL